MPEANELIISYKSCGDNLWQERHRISTRPGVNGSFLSQQEGIFTTFDDDDKVTSQISIVSSGMWSGGVGTLTAFHTSSTQSGSTGQHYLDVYNGIVGTDATASVQFSVAYGHYAGSGSKVGDSDYAASKAGIVAMSKSLALEYGKKNIKVNVWERGAGLTKACGTAACATAVAASKKGLVGENSIIHFKDGDLQIDYKDEIFMTGPVSDIKKIDLKI